MEFGFSLNPSSQVNLDKVDLSLYKKLLETDPQAAVCMACGSCTSTCTGNPYTDMSVRRVLLAMQRGRNEDVARMLSGCMLCGKCTMVCPRGINTRHLILSLCRIYGEASGQTKEKEKIQ